MTQDYQYQDMVVREIDPYANTKYKIILHYLKGYKGLNILNAGCGSGELSFMLARAGHTVIGIDPGAAYIALAEKRLPDSLKDRCVFFVSSIEHFFSNEKFDCVIATDVLEHIADDRAAAQKLASFLRSGGDLIITVPALPALFGQHDELLGHFRRYRRRQLRQLIAGMGIIDVHHLRYFGFTLIPVCWWFSVKRRQPYPLGPLGADGKFSFRRLVLRLCLGIEKMLALPFGTSLILLGKKNS